MMTQEGLHRICQGRHIVKHVRQRYKEGERTPERFITTWTITTDRLEAVPVFIIDPLKR